MIPTYNQPRFVTEALESALAQDYGNIEILIGDDSTNEETRKIMEVYEKKYQHVKYYYHGGPLGGSGERNSSYLFNYCNGEYINYLLHDDIYMPNKISRMVRWYKEDLEKVVGIVTSSRNAINERGALVNEYMNPWLPEQDVVETGENIGRYILTSFHNFIGETTTVLIRRNDLEVPLKDMELIGEKYQFATFYGYKDKSVGDVSMWLDLVRRGKMCVFIRDRLSSFRMHAAQNTNDIDIRTRCMQDWLAFAVLSFVNGMFFHSTEEARLSLCLWSRKYEVGREQFRQAGPNLTSVMEALNEISELIKSGHYAAAAINMVEDIRKRQPEGRVVIPDYYQERCFMLDK